MTEREKSACGNTVVRKAPQPVSGIHILGVTEAIRVIQTDNFNVSMSRVLNRKNKIPGRRISQKCSDYIEDGELGVLSDWKWVAWASFWWRLITLCFCRRF